MKSIISKIKFFNSEKIMIILIVISLIFYPNCSGNRIERITEEPSKIGLFKPSKEIPFMKLHMKNGDVYILNNWQVDQKDRIVTGTGNLFDLNREPKEEGKYIIPFNDIVLAETNVIKSSGSGTALAAISVITGVFTIICITNPKACFGSCPTFYAYNGNDYTIQAEGFSSSISPSLEETDIDALYRVKPASEIFELQVRNEAFETQVIRKANILALPRKESNRVFSTEDRNFFEVNNLMEPAKAVGEEGDCSEKFCAFDGVERFSAADSNNLSEKEVIELSFHNVTKGRKGLVIASRQTLLTTFLFYQGLSYMGNTAGEWLANLERNSNTVKEVINQPRQELGGIEVLIEDKKGTWQKIGEIGEHGPIATDLKIIPFDKEVSGSTLNVRLRMTKGLWRIDYIALADLIAEVNPIVIPPSEAFPKLTTYSSDVIELLTNNDSVLITLPGDKYFLHYKLPKDFENYELFLESRGYYLEWLREEWLAEENPLKVYQMFFNSKQFFKDMAPQFKKIEAEMEESFWSSKYVLP